MRPRHLPPAILLVGAGFVGLGSTQGGSGGSRAVASGGTFAISLPAALVDYVDPALSYGQPLLDVTCARLMNYPDKPPPEGYRVTPEVASGHPRVSNGKKTFTFTLRTNFRFSDGTPIRASAFARAINRNLLAERTAPGVAGYTQDIVGADAVIAGKAESAPGVVASGNRLVVSLKTPTPDFPARTTMPVFCAVPPTLPVDPEGVGTFPGSGPYYVSEYVRGQRATLQRNPFYRGARPHRVDRFVVTLLDDEQEVLDRIEQGAADWGRAFPPAYYDPARDLAGKYGTNKSRFFVKPGLVSRGYSLNVSRPLFRDNLALRRAVNYAIDRPKLAADAHGSPTDQYLPPGLPGFKNVRLYPLNGPDLRTARALARGHTRGGKAVLYTFDVAPARASAQILKGNLRQIGVTLEIVAIPPRAYYQRVNEPGAAFDIAYGIWIGAFADPYEFTNSLFDSRFIGFSNLGRFRSAKFDALMRRAATLTGAARYRAYGDLDVQLSRDAVPRVQIAFEGVPTLVSRRVGCIVLRPELDLAAVCLK